MKKNNCWRCDAALQPDDHRSLCQACLLEAGRTPPGAPAAFEAPSLVELSARFPHLEILELIGQGGMGAVYRARQPRLDREVALKILRPAAVGEGSFTERFLREARVLAKLSHPNVIGLHDFGVEGDLHWLMMEFVDGSNLRAVLAEGTLPPSDALSLVPQICEALQYAHDHGVVHRDIKPENILLDVQGRVRIVDFGLALLDENHAEAARLTGTNEVFGTPRYMAPEQIEGARQVDHRADIYALGAVFYELLTGELPLGRFDAPSKRVMGIDVRVDEVVMRALEKEPERRYQRANDVRDALDEISAGVSAPDPGPQRNPPTTPHEDALWGALCIATLLIGAAGILLVKSSFPLLLLFLPGCAFGAVMAMPRARTAAQVFAVLMLLASITLVLMGMIVGADDFSFLGMLGFGGGVGAGYSEERKHYA